MNMVCSGGLQPDAFTFLSLWDRRGTTSTPEYVRGVWLYGGTKKESVINYILQGKSQRAVLTIYILVCM